jgi:membrane-associated phospholipid phosphatase
MGALNMNMNMNMAMPGFGQSSGAPTQIRFNTADYRKLVTNTPGWSLTVNPVPSFPESWDPDLRSYIYLNDFILKNLGWEAALEVVANPYVPGSSLSTAYEPQLALVLDAAPDREDRFAEIIHQNDAEGSISYFLGMLMIDPPRYKDTYLLIRVARRIGELVTMTLKGHYMIPRPSQLCPAIVPMIDPPITPSYPAGHALEACLIAMCLIKAWANNPAGFVRQSRVDLLTYLAHRIGENRVIAGIHYPLDIQGGDKVAQACYGLMTNSGIFNDLVTAAYQESLK